MPLTAHSEQHFTAGETVRNVVIGMSDGLTVPFALVAGLSGAVSATAVVITAGFAEIAAGAIAMGLGGYLASRADAEHYASELAREQREIRESPEAEADEIRSILLEHGLEPGEAATVVNRLRSDPAAWVRFMMRFELRLEEPEPTAARRTAATIAASYVAGGLIPLAPYLMARNVRTALGWSIAVTIAALLTFGYVKGRFTGASPVRSAIQAGVIGSLAAGAAFGIARLIA